MKHLLFFFIFFLSRIFFINAEPVFFDSPEYVRRLSDPSFFNAITSGHLPLHAGYLLVFWPIFHIGQSLHLHPSYLVILFQIVLSFLTIYFFYYFTRYILEQRIALMASIIVSFTPFFWISNVTIMMETTYLFFFMASLFFLVAYLQKPDRPSYMVTSALCFGFSLLTHLVVLLWLPFIFFLVFIKKKKLLARTFIVFLISIIGFSFLNAFFISLSLKKDIFTSFMLLFTSKAQEHVNIPLNAYGLLVAGRNLLIPQFRNFTNLVILFSLLGLIGIYKKKAMFVLLVLWIIPSFITNQWWDSLFFGRHSLIAGFGLAAAAGYILERRKVLSAITVLYLLIVSVPALFLLKGNIPYLQEAEAVSKLPSGLFITSHFVRPQVEGKFKGEIFFVNEPGYDKKKLRGLIRSYLEKKQPVYVSSSALSDPYGLYSGPYLHSLSLSYAHPFELENVLRDFRIVKYDEIEKKDNLLLYKIDKEKPSPYPQIPRMDNHYRRLDYYDPILRLFLFLKNVR